MKVGFLVEDFESNGQILAYVRTSHRIADALEEKFSYVEKFHNPQRIEEYDLTILTEAWAYHNLTIGKFFEDWSTNKINSFDETKFCILIFHVRENYKKAYQQGMLEKGDVFWTVGDYNINIHKPAFSLKLGTYEIETNLEDLNKDNVIRAPLGRLSECPLRLKALKNCPLEVELYGKSRGSNTPYKKEINLPDNINYNQGYNKGMSIFRKSKFIFEAKRKDWLVPEDDPQPYWSDRIGHAVSYGAHVITNYKPALEQWESTISYDEAYNGNLEYDLDAIKRDRQKWLYRKRVPKIFEKTLDSLGMSL